MKSNIDNIKREMRMLKDEKRQGSKTVGREFSKLQYEMQQSRKSDVRRNKYTEEIVG
jgi:hypothetical protein